MKDDFEKLKALTDMQCKILLSNSQVVSRFVKCFVKEAKGLTLDEIESCICSTEITTPNKNNIPIHGINTYAFNYDERYVNFDILIKLDLPQCDMKEVRVFLNLEAQNNINPGYPLVTRGIVYCAMMISRQFGTEFDSKSYHNLKKVYSIWIMPQSSKKKDGLIRQYKINESLINGNTNLKNKKHNYDKMEIIEIYIAGDNQKQNMQGQYEELMNALKIMFSRTLDTNTRINQLKMFGFRIDPTLESEVNNMCNLSEGIVQEVTKEVTENITSQHATILVQLVKEGVLSILQAAMVLNISVNEFKAYMN